MKRLLLFFLLITPLFFYGQDDPMTLSPVEDTTAVDYSKFINPFFKELDVKEVKKTPKISTATANKMNVVYRGVANPITINVPEGVAYSASAPGLVKQPDGYYLYPGSGTEVTVIVVYKTPEGKSISEANPFKILDIPPLELRINTVGESMIMCDQCIFEFTKSDLVNATFQLNMNEAFLYNPELNVKEMRLEFAGQKTILIEGSRLSDEVITEIKKQKKGTFFTLTLALKETTELEIPKVKIMLAD